MENSARELFLFREFLKYVPCCELDFIQLATLERVLTEYLHFVRELRDEKFINSIKKN